jgi:hypothetical protein
LCGLFFRVVGGKRINAFGRRSLGDMRIAHLALFAVNEKMRCAAHAVSGNLTGCQPLMNGVMINAHNPPL